jgi:hypothetical protein
MLMLELGYGIRTDYGRGQIKDNRFENNLGHQVFINGAVSVENNQFLQNDCGNLQCLYIQYWTTGAGWETRNVTRNLFEDNFGSQIVEYGSIYGNIASFMDNSLLRNQVQIPSSQVALKVYFIE